jgi:NAD(P)-dependent dehydrogenase (short-subunit alcohol dehydrogenase family)
MQGRICLVTGATGGIGKATALGLARLGATLVLVTRDPRRGDATVAEIKQQTGNDALDYLTADLASQQSIRQLADEFKGKYRHLHVLINNAGGVFPRTYTVDGLEKTFALNHLAYFLLTELLLDVLKASAPARIVSVSSEAERGGKINFDDLQSHKRYSAMSAYSQSKLANIMWTYELARRLEGTGVTANCLHPGAVTTSFGNSIPLMNWVYRLGGRFMRTPEKGAETVIYLASSPEVEGVTGKYFQDCKPIKSVPRSYDREDARRLWQVSAELTGVSAYEGAS